MNQERLYKQTPITSANYTILAIGCKLSIENCSKSIERLASAKELTSDNNMGELAGAIKEFLQDLDDAPDDYVWEADAEMDDFDPITGKFDDPYWEDDLPDDDVYHYKNS